MLDVNIENKSYGSDVILTNVSLKLGRNKYQLVGENGSGKSTLLNIINKTDLDYEGSVLVNDKEYNSLEYISFSSQLNLLIGEFTLNDYLKIINNTDSQIDNLINIFKIKRDVKIATMSGGQQQKIQIILTLLSKCEILIFDEPYNNLDANSTIELDNILQSITNKTIILIDHRKNHDGFEVIEIKSNIKYIDKSVVEINKQVVIKPTISSLKIIKLQMTIFLLIATLTTCIFMFIAYNVELESMYAYSNSEYYYSEGEEVEGATQVVPMFYETEMFKYHGTTKAEIPYDEISLTYLDDEDYNEIKDLLLKGEYKSGIGVLQFQQPTEVIENINGPILMYSYEGMIEGSLPTNNEKELIVNQFVAGYMESMGITNIIGYEINGYTITGIYSNESFNTSVILAYDENSVENKKNLETCEENNSCGYISDSYVENTYNLPNTPPTIVDNIKSNVEIFIMLFIVSIVLFFLLILILFLTKHTVKLNEEKLSVYNQNKYPRSIIKLMILSSITLLIVNMVVILIKFS